MHGRGRHAQATSDLDRAETVPPAQVHDLADQRRRCLSRAAVRTRRAVHHRARTKLTIAISPPSRGRPSHVVTLGSPSDGPAFIDDQTSQPKTSTRSQAGSQYTSFAFTHRLVEAGVDPSVGSVGDAYDNALAESQIGLFKAELIQPESPWRGVEHVEIETLNWVDWFNHERPHEAIDDLTPAAAEQVH